MSGFLPETDTFIRSHSAFPPLHPSLPSLCLRGFFQVSSIEQKMLVVMGGGEYTPTATSIAKPLRKQSCFENGEFNVLKSLMRK